MNTFTSVTYSFQTHNDTDTIKKIEYISTVQDDEKMMHTSYNNILRNNEQQETFNKLFKEKTNVYEQIGNSRNKSNWKIKEFNNQTLSKEYNEIYDKHKFNHVTSLLINN